MTAERYVVLGVATARADWFRATSQWSSSAALPIEFVRCVSVAEARARLRTGRRFSALVVDERIHGVDRDLISAAKDTGCAVIIIGSTPTSIANKTWHDLGADDVLAEAEFDRSVFLDALRNVALPIDDTSPDRADAAMPQVAAHPRGTTTAWSGEIVAVVGTGGTGTSTIAMGLAQGLGADPRQGGLVCLADLQLDADLAMLHDAQDVVPGLQEMLDLHRKAVPSRVKVQQGCFRVDDRRYDLLLGLRQHRDWTLLRRRTTEATIASLRRSYRYVVADVGTDVEGESDTGSHDIEDRNTLARVTLAEASAVVVVGHASMQGLFALHRVIRRLLSFGVPADRLVPVLNKAPRRAIKRAEYLTGFSELVDIAPVDQLAIPSPVFLPYKRSIEEGARSAQPLPRKLIKPLSDAVVTRLDAAGPRESPSVEEPVPVAAGSLGTLSS